jgi:Ca-activated chloride channel family protein
MQHHSVCRNHTRARFLSALALGFALVASFGLVAPAAHAFRPQQPSTPTPADARPRRVQSTTAPTPTPGVRTTTTTTTTTTTAPARPGLAQPTPTPSKDAPQLQDPKQLEQEVDPDEVVRVETNLINLHVRVIDRNNRPVNDVRQDEFRVMENGVAQNIEFFTREEVPISYGLVVDNSGSMRSQLLKVIEAGKTIVNSNKPGDETFLVRFIDSDKIETVQDFTSNQNDLLDALESLYTEGGQTAVLDAVYLSAERVGQYRKGDPVNDRRRRALILVTDGEDRDSYYKQDQLFNALRENDVQIYVIGFVNELDTESGFIRKSSKDKAVNLLNKLATETGGRAFYPNSLTELPSIADEITRDLRTQYVVSYSPTNKRRDGTFRKVNVRIEDSGKRDKRIAITRPGYTAPRGGGDNNNAPTPARTSSTSSKQP